MLSRSQFDCEGRSGVRRDPGSETGADPPGLPLKLETGNGRAERIDVLRELPIVEPGRKRFERLRWLLLRKTVREGMVGMARAGYRQETRLTKDANARNVTIELPPEYWRRIDGAASWRFRKSQRVDHLVADS